MKKKVLLLAIGLVSAVVLSGCTAAKPTIPPVPTQANALETQAPTLVPPPTVPDLPEGYDPASEEDNGFYIGGNFDEYGRLLQVGATPIALDPVDMPTPTPRPSLVFNYTTVTASTLGVTFDVPADWIVDESVPGTVVITDPVMRDGYQGSITIIISSKPNTFKTADIKDELNTFIAGLHRTNFNEWKTEKPSDRKLMGKAGYYTTYRGVRYDDVIIRGRVHMSLLDGGRLLTVHLSAPGWYNESYTNVYYKVRDTIKAITPAAT